MALEILKPRKRSPGLKVRARGNAMVPDHDALNRNTRAFVGRVFDRTLAVPGESDGGWRPTVDAQTVSEEAHCQYLLAIVHGDLWAADEETALKASSMSVAKGMGPIVFDPTFGGELAELTDWLRDREAESRANAKTATTTVNPPAGEKVKG